MRKGDLLRLRLQAPGLTSDIGWLPAGLASSLNVDLVGYELQPPNQVTVVVRARGSADDPRKGSTVDAVSAASAPGVTLPSAAVTEVDKLTTRSQEHHPQGFWVWEEHEWQALKVVGSVGLIGLTAWLASRIKR